MTTKSLILSRKGSLLVSKATRMTSACCGDAFGVCMCESGNIYIYVLIVLAWQSRRLFDKWVLNGTEIYKAEKLSVGRILSKDLGCESSIKRNRVYYFVKGQELESHASPSQFSQFSWLLFSFCHTPIYTKYITKSLSLISQCKEHRKTPTIPKI